MQCKGSETKDSNLSMFTECKLTEGTGICVGRAGMQLNTDLHKFLVHVCLAGNALRHFRMK